MEARIAVVVGGTKGIGREVVRQLARQRYRVLFVGRDAAAGHALENELRSVSTVEFIQADLSLLGETRRVALLIRERVRFIHVLIHSADVLTLDRVETAEGHEIGFALNYLSRFLLNDILLDQLKAGQARILHIAAAGFMPLKASAFPPGPKANGMAGHGAGQGANDIYGLEMADRLKGTGVTINILNPGGVDTDIRRNMKLHGAQKLIMPVMMLAMKYIFRMKMQQPADYARIPVDYATNPQYAGLTGRFIKWDGTLFNIKPEQYPAELRQYIWQETEKLVAAYRPETALETAA
ncbi:MAG TPA: SDR family NAD(P)-dependent oxidoreductase [Aggregatilineales bacterium]|nr:SDR family NAD(P)-dependent oxidoreductase [Aggregatilineales bacterium]